MDSSTSGRRDDSDESQMLYSCRLSPFSCSRSAQMVLLQINREPSAKVKMVFALSHERTAVGC